MALAFLSACRKHPPGQTLTAVPAPVQYLDLNDTVIRLNRSAVFDLDGNGRYDIGFGTQLIGDPIYQIDKRQWVAFGAFHTDFAVNEAEAVPVLAADALISFRGFPGFNWYNASSILLAQQLLFTARPPVWEGLWRQATHHYMPFRLHRGERIYTGWVDMSFDQVQQRLIVHGAGVCTEPGRDIRAGR